MASNEYSIAAALVLLTQACSDNSRPPGNSDEVAAYALTAAELRLCARNGEDGEGCARFAGPEKIIAGDSISLPSTIT